MSSASSPTSAQELGETIAAELAEVTAVLDATDCLAEATQLHDAAGEKFEQLINGLKSTEAQSS
jgi:hypothetical protein